MAKRPTPTLADYAVTAISPALIMTLVGSLVFFLIQVFYLGEYDTRLNFIMAMFVMAAVLVARIAIERGNEYALLFAIPLGIVTAIATFRFVEFSGPLKGFSPLINLSLIGLIWWCANKLTWDSTVINEGEDASGEGLLQTVGLDPNNAGGEAQQAEPDATTTREEPKLTALERFRKRRERPHAPGVWVIYFSLAALPIFGFGNWFIPSADLDSRRYAFRLLVVYVASALGLLLATSFLGLRRYLRQRRLEMPNEMAIGWMGTGAAMIGALLLVCTLLPRRNAEYSVTHLPIFAGSPSDLWTTEYAVGNEGQLDPENADRTDEGQQNDSTSEKQNGDPSSDKKGGDSRRQGGKSGEPSQGQQSSGGQKSNEGSPSNDGQGGGSSKSGNQKGEQQSSNSNQANQNGSQGKQQGGSSSKSGSQSKLEGDDGKSASESQAEKGRDKKGNQASKRDSDTSDRKRDQSSQQSDDSSQKNGSQADAQKKEPSKSSQQSKSGRKSRTKSRTQPTSKFNPSKIGSALGGSIGQLLKLIYWLAVILIVGYLLWRYRREISEALRNFLKSLREFWDSLLGRKAAEAPGTPVQAAPTGTPAKPFASYSDPFLTGMAQQQAPAEVIRYSFEAFEAWGNEHGLTREPDQTPHEYAQLVGQHQHGVAREAGVLAELYCRCAYGKDPANRVGIEHLRRLWERLRAMPA